MKIWPLIILFSLFTGNLSAETVTWDFDKADEKNISGFIIYRSQERLADGKQINLPKAEQRAEKFLIKERTARQAELSEHQTAYGFYFYYIVPFKGKTKGTDFDEQVRYYSIEGLSLAEVKMETLGNTVFLSWLPIPGVENYQIDIFKKGQAGWKKTELTTRNFSTWVITEPGEWIFKVKAIMDNEIEIYEAKRLKLK